MPTKKQIEALSKAIKQDQAKSLKSAEKPLKIKATFEQAVKAIVNTKPNKQKKK
jgi:hypothetical protein